MVSNVVKRRSAWSCAVWAMLASTLCAQTRVPRIAEPISVSGGSVQGVAGATDARITVFKGIPYAAPPVGDLRWRAPQPVVAWKGVRKGDKFGNSCIQKEVYQRKPWTHEFMAHNDISEDCLYLNVWTPSNAKTDKLPVYVFLYGGGDIEGSAAVPVYDGEGLAGKGIVVVTLNYRLGLFGFFTHPELTAEAPYHASGNYAELDILAALQWVKQNIARFGGDPERVTLGGQSAGSRHVAGMMITPLAKGLFRGAIIESGVHVSVITEKSTTLAEGEKQGEQFAAAKGAKSLAELRRLSWQELFDPAAASGSAPLPVFRGDVIDGYVFPTVPREIYEQGKENDVPVLTGLNRNDNTGPVPHPDVTLAVYREQSQKLYGDMGREFLALYPAESDEEAKQALTQSTWDANRSGFYIWATWYDKTARSKVFTYFWDHVLPGPDADKYGAFHTSEVPYALNTLYMTDRPLTAADRGIADTLSSYWVNFIKNGDPNGEGLSHWPSTTEAPDMTMEIGDEYRPIPVASKQRLTFFQSYYAKPHAQPRP